MDFISIIFTVAIFQGVFLAFLLLFFSGNNNKSSKILGLLLLLISYDIFEAYCYFVNNLFPSHIDFSHPLVFLYGPLIYFYSQSLLKKTVMGKKHLFLIFLFFLPGISLLFTSAPAIYYIAYIHLLTYILLSIGSVLKSKKKTSGKSINILLKLLLLIFLLSVSGILLAFFELKGLPDSYPLTLISLIFFILVFGISFYTMNFNDFPGTGDGLPTRRNRYEKYKLGNVQDSENMVRLSAFVESSKIYMNPDLTPRILAEETGFTIHYLSMLINCINKTNFYSFINKYRIDEFKSLLRKHREINILEIALMAGFNSKSTFNKVFKDFTGVTPSVFKKNMYSSMEIDDQTP